MTTEMIAEGVIPEVSAYRAAAPAQSIVTGFWFWLAGMAMRRRILQLIWRMYRRPGQCLRVLKALDASRRAVLGPHRLHKAACVDGRYYYDLYAPGFPSPAFDAYIEAEAARILLPARPKRTARFANIILAITKKCSLQCEHCFEWDALNGREHLSADDLQRIVCDLQERGVTQIQLSGGEPMLRYADLLTLLRSTKEGTDFWLLTSGYRLNAERTTALKAAGLRGVSISLDHYDPELHNAFRGFRNAYAWVEEAVAVAKEAGLAVALSLCATRAFTTEENLWRYASSAKDLGVAFIQLLEPKATGHYAGKDVALSAEQTDLLEAFYLRINYDKAYRAFPLVTYHGYYQRRIGCFGAADRHLYIDTGGQLHPCPFCRKSCGSALCNLDEGIAALQKNGCHDFRKAVV